MSEFEHLLYFSAVLLLTLFYIPSVFWGYEKKYDRGNTVESFLSAIMHQISQAFLSLICLAIALYLIIFCFHFIYSAQGVDVEPIEQWTITASKIIGLVFVVLLSPFAACSLGRLTFFILDICFNKVASLMETRSLAKRFEFTGKYRNGKPVYKITNKDGVNKS